MLEKTMMNALRLTGGRMTNSYMLDDYIAVVFTDCASADERRVVNALFVYEIDSKDPDKPKERVMTIWAQRESDKAYSLHIMMPTSHKSLGKSENWGDLGQFSDTALALAGEFLQVSSPPELI